MFLIQMLTTTFLGVHFQARTALHPQIAFIYIYTHTHRFFGEIMDFNIWVRLKIVYLTIQLVK